jgi:hypothetical protein
VECSSLGRRKEYVRCVLFTLDLSANQKKRDLCNKPRKGLFYKTMINYRYEIFLFEIAL